MTLFELMVANSWEIMEGYANEDVFGHWSRIYFLSFYLVSLIATTVITSFMLETFLFKVEYQNRSREDLAKCTNVLSKEELQRKMNGYD